MSRANSDTKNKRTKGVKRSRGSTRTTRTKMTDRGRLSRAWRAVHNKPRAAVIRAAYPGECPRCEQGIAVGQEIRRNAEFGGYVHQRCQRMPRVLEGGQPHIVTVRRISTLPDVCRQCNTEHAGECW